MAIFAERPADLLDGERLAPEPGSTSVDTRVCRS
jgi:hypothetical protein